MRIHFTKGMLKAFLLSSISLNSWAASQVTSPASGCAGGAGAMACPPPAIVARPAVVPSAGAGCGGAGGPAKGTACPPPTLGKVSPSGSTASLGDGSGSGSDSEAPGTPLSVLKAPLLARSGPTSLLPHEAVVLKYGLATAAEALRVAEATGKNVGIIGTVLNPSLFDPIDLGTLSSLPTAELEKLIEQAKALFKKLETASSKMDAMTPEQRAQILVSMANVHGEKKRTDYMQKALSLATGEENKADLIIGTFNLPEIHLIPVSNEIRYFLDKKIPSSYIVPIMQAISAHLAEDPHRDIRRGIQESLPLFKKGLTSEDAIQITKAIYHIITTHPTKKIDYIVGATSQLIRSDMPTADIIEVVNAFAEVKSSLSDNTNLANVLENVKALIERKPNLSGNEIASLIDLVEHTPAPQRPLITAAILPFVKEKTSATDIIRLLNTFREMSAPGLEMSAPGLVMMPVLTPMIYSGMAKLSTSLPTESIGRILTKISMLEPEKMMPMGILFINLTEKYPEIFAKDIEATMDIFAALPATHLAGWGLHLLSLTQGADHLPGEVILIVSEAMDTITKEKRLGSAEIEKLLAEFKRLVPLIDRTKENNIYGDTLSELAKSPMDSQPVVVDGILRHTDLTRELSEAKRALEVIQSTLKELVANRSKLDVDIKERLQEIEKVSAQLEILKDKKPSKIKEQVEKLREKYRDENDEQLAEKAESLYADGLETMEDLKKMYVSTNQEDGAKVISIDADMVKLQSELEKLLPRTAELQAAISEITAQPAVSNLLMIMNGGTAGGGIV